MKKIIMSIMLMLSFNMTMVYAKSSIVGGRVLDTATLKPINNIKVYYDGKTVTTDANGYFVVNQNELKGGVISVGSIAFEKTSFYLPTVNGNNLVLLTLDRK